MGHAKKERVLLFGTDQRITSGPAAERLRSKAGYMDEFFALSRTATSPFMRLYYRRVGERYLSSQGELRVPSERRDNAGSGKSTDR
jgi:hypothetical protein